MRFEAKHRHFKRIAKVVGNFINIAKTLSHRHQRYMCHKLSSPSNYLKDSVEFGPGKYNEPFFSILILKYYSDICYSLFLIVL